MKQLWILFYFSTLFRENDILISFKRAKWSKEENTGSFGYVDTNESGFLML